ncbi:hypothetical protein GW17_00052189 [Ensete ventricosum]|nr:hypothetical protein GW17_00052189 [Ensete ventricosum]RZS03418.1 hypothetical protein BHM03_00033600 [Ensete ventricosum]
MAGAARDTVALTRLLLATVSCSTQLFGHRGPGKFDRPLVMTRNPLGFSALLPSLTCSPSKNFLSSKNLGLDFMA